MEAYIVAEYIWLDSNQCFRSKSRVLPFNIDDRKITLPEWNFDGSSTNQACSDNSEVILVPVAKYEDPFRPFNVYGVRSFLVLCECYESVKVLTDLTTNLPANIPLTKPIPTNTRAKARIIFGNPKIIEEKIWYGIEQEYVLYNKESNKPLGWPAFSLPAPQGNYYCGVGANNIFGRDIAEQHYAYCLKSGVKIGGINAEVMPSQWEFQIGICEGIRAADDLMMARYILERICEMHNIIVSYSPKPEIGDWNGSGLHTNYSSKKMREDNGIKYIMEAMDKLNSSHSLHISNYGDNSKRLIGTHETSSLDKFTYGVGSRSTSVRIPTTVYNEGKGYFEDRRPAANADPYIVTSLLAKTIHLD